MKKKVILLGITTVTSLVLAGAIVVVSKTSGMLESRASNATSGSIVFSRSAGTFTKIDNKTASVSGSTSNGNVYYAVSHNINDITDTNYVAQFGSGVATNDQYVSFSASATGSDDIEFQGITGIKVYTASGSNQTMYLRYSTNGGETFNNQETISGSTNPDKYTFSKPHQYVRLVGYSTFARNITTIELFYDCGE